MADFADARPTKAFFIEMFTRDISLEDAVLDLVDNCIDSLARSRNLPLNAKLLDTKASEKASEAFQEEDALPRVEITLSKDEFSISDNCGGMSYASAKDHVFRFGRVVEEKASRLSVYGVGLKRALLKLGGLSVVESHGEDSGFRVTINVEKWASDPDNNWHFPLEELPAAKSARSQGTKIVVTKLNPDIRLRIDDGQLIGRIHTFIATAYALLLDKFVVIKVNNARVRPSPIPLATSTKLRPAREDFDVDDVHVTVITGLAERVDEKWNIDRAGWYIFCNGRVVLAADRSEATGWGVTSAQFVSKYSGFVGLAFFFAKDPESLPWTTTKRGLNRESRAYLVARNRMAVTAKPVLGFLNSMYASGETEEPVQRTLASAVKPVEIGTAMKVATAVFRPVVPAVNQTRYVSIQYKAKKDDIERIKKHVRKPYLSAGDVGRHTFNHFLERECAE